MWPCIDSLVESGGGLHRGVPSPSGHPGLLTSTHGVSCHVFAVLAREPRIGPRVGRQLRAMQPHAAVFETKDGVFSSQCMPHSMQLHAADHAVRAMSVGTNHQGSGSDKHRLLK
jgi:hypothetical protein